MAKITENTVDNMFKPWKFMEILSVSFFIAIEVGKWQENRLAKKGHTEPIEPSLY